MQVDKISFQAYMPKKLNEKLFYAANEQGHAVCRQYLSQVKNVESWGLDTSCITDVKPDGKKCLLSLVNTYLAPFKRVELPQKDNLLDTFLALTERDIQNAENILHI